MNGSHRLYMNYTTLQEAVEQAALNYEVNVLTFIAGCFTMDVIIVDTSARQGA